MERYNRQIKLKDWGKKSQDLVASANVLVVGAGGLGCPVLQYLTSCGVGEITVMDGDNICLSNLQRQVLFSEADIGRNKAEAAVERLQGLNSDIKISALNFFLDKDNALDLISSYDLVIEGSDNFACKYLVNDACVIANKPWVSGSIESFTGQLSVFNYQGGPSYRCLFPEQGNGSNCNEIGVLGTLPGIIGSLMANEALKVLADLPVVYSGKLLQIDAFNNTQIVLNIQRDEWNFKRTELSTYEAICSGDEIAVLELSKRIEEGFQNIWDVRESHELEAGSITDKFLPLSQLEKGLLPNELRDDAVLYCQSGVRSIQAMEILKSKGFKEIKSLQGGYNKWVEKEHI